MVFSVKDESGGAVTNEIINALKNFGLKENLYDAGLRKSYIAVLNETDLMYEEIGDEILSYDNELSGVLLHVESVNFNGGNYAVIQVNGIDYSVNGQGLNIVVLDKNEKTVVDSVSFNTYADLSLTQ